MSRCKACGGATKREPHLCFAPCRERTFSFLKKRKYQPTYGRQEKIQGKKKAPRFPIASATTASRICGTVFCRAKLPSSSSYFLKSNVPNFVSSRFGSREATLTLRLSSVSIGVLP